MKNQVDGSGRLNIKDYEKKTGLTLGNYGILRTRKYKASIAHDVFRYLIEWQMKGEKDISQEQIDYYDLVQEGIDLTDLKDVIDFVVERGESWDVIENKDFEQHIKDSSETVFDIK
jgi:hypothetical protein